MGVVFDPEFYTSVPDDGRQSDFVISPMYAAPEFIRHATDAVCKIGRAIIAIIPSREELAKQPHPYNRLY